MPLCDPTLQLLARSGDIVKWAAGVSVFKNANLLAEVRGEHSKKWQGL